MMLPFLLYNPDGFTPFSVHQRYRLHEEWLPYASLMRPIGLLIVSGWLGWRARDVTGLMTACGLTLLLPILAAVFLKSVQSGQLTVAFNGWYAIISLPFLVFAVFGRLVEVSDTNKKAVLMGS